MYFTDDRIYFTDWKMYFNFNASCPAALADANADWANVINIG